MMPLYHAQDTPLCDAILNMFPWPVSPFLFSTLQKVQLFP